MKLFVINQKDAYAGTEGLAPGTIAANPERPSVAHVVQGQVAVWTSGQNGYYWKLQQATPAQIAAYDRAPRVAVTEDPLAVQPPAQAAATVPASAASTLASVAQAAGPNSWEGVIATAMRSGLMTESDLAASLKLLGSGAKPSTSPPTSTRSTLDPAAIYAAHNDPQQRQPTAQDVWDHALAKVEASRPQPRTAQVQRAMLDPAAIYAQHNQPRTDAAAIWDKAIASMQNPQRN